MIRVLSRIPINADLKEKIIEKVGEYFNVDVSQTNVDFQIDEKIIAGIKIIKDSEVLDLTLNYRINQILSLIEENVY